MGLIRLIRPTCILTATVENVHFLCSLYQDTLLQGGEVLLERDIVSFCRKITLLSTIGSAVHHSRIRPFLISCLL